ncbi:hypothetical protein ACFLRI_05010 [Bacteroidota bacterium]
MQRIIVFIALCTSLVLLLSCEGQTIYYKKVINKSSETVTIKFYSTFSSNAEDSFVIEPSTDELIYWSEQRGGNQTAVDCASNIDSVLVWISNNKNLTKSLLDESNWSLEMKVRKYQGFVDQTCVFDIHQTDIQ